MTPSSPVPRRILLIQLRRLGDVVLTTALLEDFGSAFPGAAVDFLVGPAAAPLLAGHPRISERIVFDPDRRSVMTREIRSRRYDWVVDLQGSLSTSMLARASGARVRLGWRVRASPRSTGRPASRHARQPPSRTLAAMPQVRSIHHNRAAASAPPASS